MNTNWEKRYTLRAGDFDKFNRIKPSAILDLFQDAAGQHAEELGLGFLPMLERSYLWVITRVAFEIVGTFTRYQNITVKTWPLEPRSLLYRREYCITDEKGELLVKGTSDWVILHSEKRRFLSVPNLYPFEDGFCCDLMFEEKLAKLPDFEAEKAPYVTNVQFSELDVNDHVNNIKYADYVMNAVMPTENDVLKFFQLEYRKEVMYGAQLNLYHVKDGKNISLKGQNPNGDTMFACKIELQ